jgi:hypothetical protein
MAAHLTGNPAWLNYPSPTTPITATALENLEAAVDGRNPLVRAGLRASKLTMTKLESVAVASGVEQVMLNVTGPGVVESLWMALGGGFGPCLDARLRVFYDGSATPAIDIDFGTLLATHFNAGTANIVGKNTPHISVQVRGSNADTGFLITFPMPFGTSIKVTYYNTSLATGFIYSMATYRTTAVDYAAGQRLRAQGARYSGGSILRTAGAVTTLANITSGPGWIVWHSQVGGVGAVNLSWLERNFSIKVDGEATPSLVATGTEDWFDSAWYFQGYQDFMSGLYSYVGTDADAAHNTIAGMATDLLGKWGGVPFTTSAIMTADAEPACNTGDRFCYVILYYGV